MYVCLTKFKIDQQTKKNAIKVYYEINLLRGFHYYVRKISTLLFPFQNFYIKFLAALKQFNKLSEPAQDH